MGHEIEVFVTVECLHPGVTIIQTVLPRDLLAPREVINALESAQVAVNVRLYCTSAPNQNDLVRIKKIAVSLISDVQEFDRRHSIVLVRLREPLLF